jgi:hypothetical protein
VKLEVSALKYFTNEASIADTKHGLTSQNKALTVGTQYSISNQKTTFTADTKHSLTNQNRTLNVGTQHE